MMRLGWHSYIKDSLFIRVKTFIKKSPKNPLHRLGKFHEKVRHIFTIQPCIHIFRNGNVIPFLFFESCIKMRSEEHTSELQSRGHLVCRLLLEKKNKQCNLHTITPHYRQ